MSPMDGQTLGAAQDDEDGALSCALAAMRREGLGDRGVRKAWADALAQRDHSSPASRIEHYFRPPEGCAVIVRRALRLDAAESADLAATRAMLAYWARMAGGFMPTRSHCDPVLERPLLTPWLALADLDAPESMRFRVAGSEIERFAGRTLRGRDGAAIAPEQTALWRSALRLLARTQAPTLIKGVADYSDGRARRFEVALAPLATPHGALRYALAALGVDPGETIRPLRIGGAGRALFAR